MTFWILLTLSQTINLVAGERINVKVVSAHTSLSGEVKVNTTMTRDEIADFLIRRIGYDPVETCILLHDAVKEEDALKLKEMEADAAQAAVGGDESWIAKVDAYAYAAAAIRASKVNK